MKIKPAKKYKKYSITIKYSVIDSKTFFITSNINK